MTRTQITTEPFFAANTPTCACGAKTVSLSLIVIGPVDGRTMQSRYPGVTVCPKCRTADLVRLAPRDKVRIRAYLKTFWVPMPQPITARVEL